MKRYTSGCSANNTELRIVSPKRRNKSWANKGRHFFPLYHHSGTWKKRKGIENSVSRLDQHRVTQLEIQTATK